MFKKRALILCAAILSTIILIDGNLAFAGNYTVSYWSVQNRTYENGETYNLLWFEVQDEFGSPVLTDVVGSVGSIELAGTGVPDPLPEHTFRPYETLSGYLDTTSGQWIYDAGFDTRGGGYWVKFSGDLAAGVYGLTVTDEDGDTMTNAEPSIYFNGVVEMPEISSKSFRGFEDAAGNLFWQWDPPADISLWTGSVDMSIRCWLEIFDGNDYAAEVYVRVPAIVGGMYVPSYVLNLARQKGDNIRIGLHLRTNDNQNRYYPNSIALNALKAGKAGKVVVVPLM